MLGSISTALGNVMGAIGDFFSGDGDGEKFSGGEGAGSGWSSDEAGWDINTASGSMAFYSGGTAFTPDEQGILDNLGVYYNDYQNSVGAAAYPYFITREGDATKYYNNGYIYQPIEDGAPTNLTIHAPDGYLQIGDWYNNGAQFPNYYAYGKPSASYNDDDGKTDIVVNFEGTTQPIMKVRLDKRGAPPCSTIPGAYIDDCGQCVLAGQGCTPTTAPYVPYTLTPAEQAIWNQIHQEDILSDGNPNPCHGTMRSGQVKWYGTMQHWIIMLNWLMEDPVNHDVEYFIPNSSSITPGNPGYADLVNLSTYEIFEIKPLSSADKAKIEAQNYVAYANIKCPPAGFAQWRLGTFYNERELPSGYPMSTMVVKNPQPGAITYEYKTRIPAPIVVPTSVIDKIKELAKRLKGHLSDAEMIITEYLKSPAGAELKNYIKTAAVGAFIGIVVGTIAEDIVTEGAGILDDWASFKLAYKIVRFAWRL